MQNIAGKADAVQSVHIVLQCPVLHAMLILRDSSTYILYFPEHTVQWL